MARRFPCPQCAKEMLLERIHEGFDVPCPACGHRFLVPPGAGSTSASAAPPPPPPPGAWDAVPGSASGASDPPPSPSVRHPDPRPVLSDDGTVAMVVGIVALVVCSLLGPVAWYLGHRVRAEAREAGVEPPGPATAGFVLGIVATGLVALTIVGFTLFFAVFAAGNF